MEIVLLVIGLAAGFAAAWIIAAFKHKSEKGIPNEEFGKLQKEASELSAKVQVAEERTRSLDESLQARSAELERKSGVVFELSNELSAKDVELGNLNEKLETEKQEIEKLQERFTKEFENLANRILQDNSRRFAQQNIEGLDTILKPLNEKIGDFRKKVEEVYHSEALERNTLKEEIKHLAQMSNRLSDDAKSLADALKGDVKKLGDWGEVVLERILEQSGLVRGREYFIQPSYKTDGGANVRPDVIIAFPEERNVIVDSKVSLHAYERYTMADDEDGRQSALKEHLRSVRAHIDGLSAKSYQNIPDINSFDFVMMFIPIEPAYLLAMQGDPDIWNYAYEKRIVMISPTNLIAVLKMAESIWRQDRQSKNALEIAQKAGDMYDKFVGFITDMQKIKSGLNTSLKAYDSAEKKLHTGRGNLVRRAEEIKEMGAKTAKSLPKKLLDEAEE